MESVSDDPAVQSTHEIESDGEEEDECRVCRGPAEEGRPLFAPCKCSGSIGLVHQDCLMSWLEVTRKDGRCELCKTKFRFDPQYAENAPDRLSPSEVVLGLSRRFVARWLPLAMRILLAATLWLVVAPLMTACLYHGWMHRPSSIVTRLKRELVFADIVSGGIIAALVIISFLSLMSFADFLRGHWHPHRGNREGERPRRDRAEAQDDGSDTDAEDEKVVDKSIVDLVKRNRSKAKSEAGDVSNESNGFFVIGDEDDGWSTTELGVDREIDEEEEDEAEDGAAPLQNMNRNEFPFDPLDPALQDDQVDMEINVALDELLGLRGPISALVRNLLWLLAFNATYLGVFTFIPKTVGSTVYTGLLNTTSCDTFLKSIPFMYSEVENTTTIITSLQEINAVSVEKNTTFRLPDIATIVLGYLSIGIMTVVLRYAWFASQKLQKQFTVEGTRMNGNGHELRRRLHNERGNGGRQAVPGMPHMDEQEIDLNPGEALGVVFDGTVAVVKVGILLCLKMFALPLFLGLCLDASTMSLFNDKLSDRLNFAGSDLFSFVLLHWVAGITFMLLVTVFLLQFREVVHPDVLARVIRPQEPQPDLLGNLLNEGVTTHMKRMVLSLAIYAPLLLLHVTLPVQLIIATGAPKHFSFFSLKFWHIALPQLQVPFELIFFHLSMLALLERYKNSIGGMQHNWMKFMCQHMGLTEYLLPLETKHFELIGTKGVFSKNANGDTDDGSLTVDPFWYDLASKSSKKQNVDSFIEAEMLQSENKIERVGETRENGERVINDISRIQLPERNDKDSQGAGDFLPTKIGHYRLSIQGDEFNDMSRIEIWKEVRGKEISRPPEGWDDLGAGGAFVQGRWAWGREKKSVIERTVAARREFRDKKTKRRPFSVMLKVCSLALLSWVAITFTVLGFISVPLAVGRAIYFVFRIPTSYMHDPFAFVLGSCLFYPAMSLLAREFKLWDGNILGRIQNWLSSLHLPPRNKVFVFLESLCLWNIVAPVILGVCFEISVVKSPAWYAGEEAFVDVRSVCMSWLLGSVVLNAWAFFMYFKVFTKSFWASIGNGMLEPAVDENGNIVPPRNNGRPAREEEENEDGWQGRRGRIARFFSILKAAAVDWEWERVDRRPLLDEFARPVARHLSSTLLGSSLCFQFLICAVLAISRFEEGPLVAPLMIGSIERGLFRLVAFRICMAAHITVQVCSACRVQLESWFEVAHTAARDDRYLIGEILMNYADYN